MTIAKNIVLIVWKLVVTAAGALSVRLFVKIAEKYAIIVELSALIAVSIVLIVDTCVKAAVLALNVRIFVTIAKNSATIAHRFATTAIGANIV